MIDVRDVTHREAAYASISLIGSAGSASSDDHRNASLLLTEDAAKAVVIPQRAEVPTALLSQFLLATSGRGKLSNAWEMTESAIDIANELSRVAANEEMLSGETDD